MSKTWDKVRNWLWVNTFEPALGSICLTLILIGSIGSVVGSMFGIAWIVETYGAIYLLLFIPWFLVLSTILKLFDDRSF